MGEQNYYVNYVEPFITIGTFIIATMIGIQNAKELWINGLTKKLTVHCKHEDKYVFTCHKAFLSGESDIRQMGQQISKQMNDNKILSFLPYVQLTPPTIERQGKEIFKHYVITFYLSNSDQGKYTIWWDNDPQTPGNKKVEADKQNEIIDENEAEALLNSQTGTN